MVAYAFSPTGVIVSMGPWDPRIDLPGPSGPRIDLYGFLGCGVAESSIWLTVT
jgi:hypothetical protein